VASEYLLENRVHKVSNCKW